jgi:hypothetical protein
MFDCGDSTPPDHAHEARELAELFQDEMAHRGPGGVATRRLSRGPL